MTLGMNDYLTFEYSLEIMAQPEGGYVLVYPDLPGCMTQVETLDEVAAAANDIRSLWIRTQFEDGFPVPLPTFEDEYSGKFVLRIPKSLHRRLATAARKDGVSLNQYAMTLLDRNDALAQVQAKVCEMDERLTAIDAQAGRRPHKIPTAAR